MAKLDPFISARASLRRRETSQPQRHELERYFAGTRVLSAACDAAEPTTARGVAAVVEVAASLADDVPVLADNLRAVRDRITGAGLTPAAIEDVRSWHRLTTAFAAGQHQWDAEACIAALAKALAAAERLQGAMPRAPGRRPSRAA